MLKLVEIPSLRKCLNTGIEKIGNGMKIPINLKRAYTSQGNTKRTPLYDFHVSHGGKMVDYAGWSMPVQYEDGALAEHHHTRTSASIFDVSHMLQTHITGKDQIKFIESLVVGDIGDLPVNTGTLTLFTNDRGGIIDDLIVSKTSEGYLYVVSNAGCADKDLVHMQNQVKKMRSEGSDVKVEPVNDFALIALQGPKMCQVLQPIVSHNLKSLPFMTTVITSLFGIENCRISRCGYTGEDGVEISIPSKRAVEVVDRLLKSDNGNQVKMAGLGARDSLRLEAGLCLYGSDIDEDITPVEAALMWTIAKRRRDEKNFPGVEVILKQLKDRPTRRRVGIVSVGPPARGGSSILNKLGEEIGHVTSGCPSPTLKKNVAFGYVKTPFAKAATPIRLVVRKKTIDGEITKLPFLPAKYYTV